MSKSGALDVIQFQIGQRYACYVEPSAAQLVNVLVAGPNSTVLCLKHHLVTTWNLRMSGRQPRINRVCGVLNFTLNPFLYSCAHVSA